MIHSKNISRWVEFAPIDTYRIDGIGRRYMQEKNYSYETVHMCVSEQEANQRNKNGAHS